ncbi:MAG: hypothetical protein QOK47_1278 [Actinomycetota bacterium]|jgi:hypothetical protein|nr:hypothetical protein [Actinomycetota bacterium]
MRRSIAAVLALAVLTSLAVPALAGGKKIKDSFGASLAPFPNYSSATATARPGCSGGQEGVNWVGQEFTAPANGLLHVHMDGFTGDHDLYVFSEDIPLGRGEQSQVPDGAPAEEDIKMPLKAKQKVVMVACNWLGSPDVQATYEFSFTK